MSPTSLSPQPHRPLLQARLLLPDGHHTLATLIDSGADECIISGEVARQLQLEQVPLPQSIPAHALDGHCLGTITHQTSPVITMRYSNFHSGLTQSSSGAFFFLLCFPWLQQHNPHIDWEMGVIKEWGARCHLACFKQAASPVSPSPI